MKANKQTAVEWLSQELNNIIELYPSEWEKINKVFEQAKEMEKEQLEVLKDFDTWKEWKNETK
jgi:thiaminase